MPLTDFDNVLDPTTRLLYDFQPATLADCPRYMRLAYAAADCLKSKRLRRELNRYVEEIIVATCEREAGVAS